MKASQCMKTYKTCYINTLGSDFEKITIVVNSLYKI